MGSLVNDNLFLILLLLGGCLVCIRAHELYSVPTATNDARWLMDEMQLRYLTGRRKFKAGLLFYLCPILLLYIMLSVSPDLLGLIVSVAGTSNSVGAMSIPDSQVQTFAPLLAATAVITLLTIKPFSTFEQAIRQASHSIAGIPQHIQNIIRQVRQMDFRDLDPVSSISGFAPNRYTAIPCLEDDLLAIGKLHDWIFGTTGLCLWADSADQALQSARSNVLSQYDDLRARLSQRSHVVGGDDSNAQLSDVDIDAMEELVRKARDVRVQLTRLLAVLVANQDEALPAHVASTALWQLVAKAQRQRASSRHINVLATSTLIGFLVCLCFAALFNLTLIFFNDLLIDHVALDSLNTELYIFGQIAGNYYWSSLTTAFATAWWDVLGLSLIFFSGSLAALAYRAAKVNSAEWEFWHGSSHPVFQYITVVLISSVCAGLVYLALLFVQLVALPSINVNYAGHFASMLRDFGSEYMTFGLLGLLSAPSAVAVCRLSDSFHRNPVSEYQGVDSEAIRKFKEANNGRRYGMDPLVRMMVWSVALVSMALYLFIRLLIGEVHQLERVLVSACLPGVSLFLLCLSYWSLSRDSTEQRPQVLDSLERPVITDAPTPGSPASVVRHSDGRQSDRRQSQKSAAGKVLVESDG